MKYLTLENYIEENINDKVLETLKLEPQNMTDADRLDAWTKKISGSKIKDVSTRPLTLVAYLLGMLNQEVWEKSIRSIPKMNLYRDHGKLMEDIIIDRTNACIENTGSDNDELIKFEDALVDFTAVNRVRDAFVPALNTKHYIKADKRTFLRKGNEHSSLFMLNIDGYTTNADGSVRHLVEVKTKTGALGNDYDFGGYVKLHFDQITYYSKMLNASHGAILLVDHHSRGLKIHTFSNREIDNNWKILLPKINAVGKIIAGTRSKTHFEEVMATIETLTWGEEEEVTKENLIAGIKQAYGKA